MPLNRQQIAVVDFENFVGQIPQYPPLSVVRACATVIERIATEQYPDLEMAWRIAAFSSEESGQEEEARYIIQASRLLDRMGYSVFSVHRRRDAADQKITRHAIALLHDRRIKLCLLATQDSGTPFVEFLNRVKIRTRIHLVGHDYIPNTFAAEGIPFSLIGEDILRLLEAFHPGPCPQRAEGSYAPPRLQRSEAVQAALPVVPPAPPRLPSACRADPVAPTIRESALAFLNHRPVADPQHLKWVEQVFRIIQTTIAEGWQLGFFSLYQKVRWNISRPFPPDDTLRDIVDVMADRFFQRRSILVPKEDAMESFLRKIGQRFSS